MPYPNPPSTEKTSTIGSRNCLQPAWVETVSVDVTVAISTKGDQIFVYIVAQTASRANMVDLETIGTAAVLASPSITFQHFNAKFAIRICVEPKSRSSRLEIIHRTLSICFTNSVFWGSGSNE
jgi:hypothetical protein